MRKTAPKLTSAKNYPSVTVHALTVDYQVRPVTAGLRPPVLGWQLSAPGRRNITQSAYQVRVACHPDPARGDDLLWDSGRVEGGASFAVPYRGPALTRSTDYHWCVRVWTQDEEPTGWSEPGRWSTGLDAGDWTARWVEPRQEKIRGESRSLPEIMAAMATDAQEPASAADEKAHDSADRQLPPALYLRRSFHVTRSVAKATLSATARGIYTAEMNGQRVGDTHLAPEPAPYHQISMYQTYDLSEHVRLGENVIGFTLAAGWWAGHLGWLGQPANYGNAMALLAQIDLEYDDGSRDVIATDSDFVSSTGAIAYADLLVGERIDARRHQDGWSEPGFDDSEWSRVAEVGDADDTIVPQIGEPIRAIAYRSPLTIDQRPDGTRIFDFGQIVTGHVRLQLADPPAGSEVTLWHVQQLDTDGRPMATIHGANNDNIDVYVTAGRPLELFEPLHTFHAFRYVVASGLPVPPEAIEMQAVAVSSDLASTFDLDVTNGDLTALHRNVGWTLRDNYLGIPMDNPDRERAGWTGDFGAVIETAATYLAIDRFAARFLQFVEAEQLPDGTVPMVIPFFRCYRESAEEFPGTYTSAAWGDIAVIAPSVLYERYGDRRAIEDNYEVMKRFLHHVEAEARLSVTSADLRDPDLAVIRRAVGHHLGDWLVPSVTGVTPTGLYDPLNGLLTMELTPTLYYIRSVDLFVEAARVLERWDDVHHYSQLAERLRRGFRKAFVDDGGKLSLDLQGSYVLALAFRVAPDLDAAFARRLHALIVQNEGRLDTGFLSTPHLLPVLCENGLSNVAYDLLLSDGVPSWLHMLRNGATTVWEMWDAIGENEERHRVSYVQPGLSTVGRFLCEGLLGIRPGAPGYRHVVIEPFMDPRVGRAGGVFESVSGSIRVEWTAVADERTLLLDIPANASATVVLHGANASEVALDGRPADGEPGVLSLTDACSGVRAEVGSGRYFLEYRVASESDNSCDLRPEPLEDQPDRAPAALTALPLQQAMNDERVARIIGPVVELISNTALAGMAGSLTVEAFLRLVAPKVGIDAAESMRQEVAALER